MRDLTRCFLFLVLLAGCASFCLAQKGDVKGVRVIPPTAEHNPETWKRFSSNDGSFSVLFPGTPVEETRTVASPDGGVPMRSFTVKTAVEYSVVYADYPWPIENTERLDAFLASVRDSGVRGVNGRLIDDREESFDGHPGRAYRLAFGGGYILSSRTIVVENRLYVVAATILVKNAPVEVAQRSEVDAFRFLESFKLSPVQGEGCQADNTDPLSESIEGAADGEVSRLLKELDEKNKSIPDGCKEGVPCGRVMRKDDKDEVQKGKVIAKPLPPYPPIAKAARVSGTVCIQVVVDEAGKVIAAQTLNGHPLLQAASLKAARQTTFSPTLVAGKPVKAIGVITFNFILQ